MSLGRRRRRRRQRKQLFADRDVMTFDYRWAERRPSSRRTTQTGDLSFFRIAPFDTRRSASLRSASTQLAVLFSVHFSQSTFTTFSSTSQWPKPKRRKTRTVSWRTSWPVVSPLPCRRPPSLRSSASSLSCKCRPLPRRSQPTNSTKVRRDDDIICRFRNNNAFRLQKTRLFVFGFFFTSE